MSATRLSEIRNIRLEKAEKLRALGINPYPSESKRTHSNATVISDFLKLDSKEVSVVGRLMSWREHGEIIFGHLQDETGKLQIFIQKDKLQKTNSTNQNLGFDELNLVDVGDFLEVVGIVGKTVRGEISIVPSRIRIITKSLRPLPEKWEGLKDQETIFRKRYLDLIMDQTHLDLFVRKAKFWNANREFLKHKGFIEVETPVLEHVTGGADAKPFMTHHNALDEDFYLRISTELYQKRLIAGGLEKIYTLGPNFRNEGIDDEHLQEYYQIEWYWAYADYRDNMKLTQDMFRYIAKEVYGTTKFESKGHSFDLADEWEEIDYTKVIHERFGVDVIAASEESMNAILKKEGVVLEGGVNRARIVDNLWKIIRKTVAGPAFLINTPKFISPLAKSIQGREDLTERFQIVIAGTELGNGYSELNDPLDQYSRFIDQQAARDAGDDEAQMMDIDYVEMLEYGMPPVSGYGHSERVFWILEGLGAREATLFPQMKFRIDDSVSEIYPDFKVPRKAK